MKQLTFILKAALPLLVLAALASCNGSFTDPGAIDAGVQHISSSGWGDNGGSGDDSKDSGKDDSKTASKPSKLDSSSASYTDALGKLDEIISYCDKNSGNTTEKATAQNYKDIVTATGSSGWSAIRSTDVRLINAIIDSLT